MNDDREKNIFDNDVSGINKETKSQDQVINNQQDNDKQTASYEYVVEETIPPFQPQQNVSYQATLPQQPVYSNQPQNNNPNWSMPPQGQQTDWSYNQYGSLGTAPQTPPKPPKQKKAPKPPKQKKPYAGLKVFAVVISAMLVVSIGLSAVLFVIIENEKKALQPEQSSGDKKNELILNDAPKLEQNETPTNGALTTQQVFKKASPSVVGIVTYVKQGGHQVYGQGSGVILTNDGYIVTNAHVVLSDDALKLPISKIEVVLSDGEYYQAELIGTDTKTDIGVLKISAPNLVPAELGSSDQLEVGEPAIVIGNPDGVKFANSLTQGAISALNREVETSTTGKPVKYIQTDATINPGNSGGAMVNQFGQVVGIPVAKIVKTGFEGMGFAIPINDAKPIVESIIKNGYVAGRPKIGIWYSPIPESYSILNGLPKGLRVSDVDEKYDAYSKGVQKGDIITHMDDIEMVDSAALAKVIDTKSPGDTIKLTIYRVNESGIADTINIDIILGEEKPIQ